MSVDRSSGFPRTRWSVVVKLRTTAGAEHVRAFSELCEAYWRPLYTFARRCGHVPEDAEDFTQGFFAQLIRRGDMGNASGEKGRLRLFLKSAFRNFIFSEIRRATRPKRGGGVPVLPFDIETAERQFQKIFITSPTPDEAFDRHWARTILQRALAELRKRYAARGRADTLRELEVYLGPDEKMPAYAETADRLKMSRNAVAAAIHRLREEFREVLRAEAADTLAEGEDVEDELRYLLRALG